MTTVVVYEIPGHPRSRAVCLAMEAGIRKVGDRVQRVSCLRYRSPTSEIAVFYGLASGLAKVFKDYCASPRLRAVYIDLGYFARKEGGSRFTGHHKISVDARHPTSYFQDHDHDGTRLARLGIDIEPWRERNPRGHILLAGMGPKGAGAENYAPLAWETEATRVIKQHTSRRIVYRPKPNWIHAKPIPGTEFSQPGKRTLAEDLRGCHAIVSHHSNANVEALAKGVPSFTVAGVASVLSLSDLTQIREPINDGDREKFLRDVSYQQWSVAEMALGLPWRYLKDSGVIP